MVFSMPHAGRLEADGDALQDLLTEGVLPILAFHSENVDATLKAVRASSAEVLRKPLDQPGPHTVRISQALAA
jgi:hypothetical protein